MVTMGGVTPAGMNGARSRTASGIGRPVVPSTTWPTMRPAPGGGACVNTPNVAISSSGHFMGYLVGKEPNSLGLLGSDANGEGTCEKRVGRALPELRQLERYHL